MNEANTLSPEEVARRVKSILASAQQINQPLIENNDQPPGEHWNGKSAEPFVQDVPLPNAAECLLQTDEPEEEAVKGVFDRGDRVAVVGQSKSKKTFHALQLSVCFASGTPFLGWPVVKQKTLIVNGEVRPRKYKNRLRGIINRLGINQFDLDMLTPFNTRDVLPINATIDVILRRCLQGGFTVCIIDPAYTFFGDECDPVEVKLVIGKLKAFSQSGITLVTYYHAAKGNIGDRQTIDRISGSGVFARDADAIISLAIHENGSSIVTDMSLRNYPERPKQTIQFDDGAFVLSDLAPVERTSRSRTKQVFDCYAVATNVPEGANYKDAWTSIKEAMGIGEKAARGLISECVSKGLLKKETHGKEVLYKHVSND